MTEHVITTTMEPTRERTVDEAEFTDLKRMGLIHSEKSPTEQPEKEPEQSTSTTAQGGGRAKDKE